MATKRENSSLVVSASEIQNRFNWTLRRGLVWLPSAPTRYSPAGMAITRWPFGPGRAERTPTLGVVLTQPATVPATPSETNLTKLRVIFFCRPYFFPLARHAEIVGGNLLPSAESR